MKMQKKKIIIKMKKNENKFCVSPLLVAIFLYFRVFGANFMPDFHEKLRNFQRSKAKFKRL